MVADVETNHAEARAARSQLRRDGAPAVLLLDDRLAAAKHATREVAAISVAAFQALC